MQIESNLINCIDEKQLTWYGYVKRINNKRSPKGIIEWEPTGKGKRGRPKKIEDTMRKNNIKEEEAFLKKPWKRKNKKMFGKEILSLRKILKKKELYNNISS